MSYINRLKDNIYTQCPGIAEAVLSLELWNVLDDACRQGWIWIEGVPVTIVPGELSYDITIGGVSNFRAVHTIAIEHDTYDVSGISVENDNLLLPNDPTEADAATALRVQLAVAPSDDVDVNTALPATLFSRNFQLFLHGLLGRCFAHPGKPYTNPTLAQFHMRKFQAACTAERHRLRSGDDPNKPLWRFPRFTR